jgi:hypothetical protein
VASRYGWILTALLIAADVMSCLVQPENQDSNPYLPLHPDLVLSCGANGGTINAITFASWGLPIGYCGNFGRMIAWLWSLCLTEEVFGTVQTSTPHAILPTAHLCWSRSVLARYVQSGSTIGVLD